MDIKELIKKGCSEMECIDAILKNDENIAPEDAVASYKNAKKSFDAQFMLELEKEEAAEEAKINEKAKAVAEKALENIKVEGILEKAISTGRVHVSEPEGQWKADQAKMLSALVNVKKYGAGHKSAETVSELRTKFDQAWGQKATGVRTDSDAAGGYFVRPEFDAEVDKLVYKRSALLEAIQIRQGGEKTDINSLSTFNFTLRADQNTAIGTTVPTFAQQRVEYREAGAIVAISQYAMEASEYNLVDELIENAADAKIRFLEPAITTGKESDGDAFDGIRFHTGVTTSTIIDNGTGGTLVSKDLSNAYLAAASQSRNFGSFVLDTRELQLLREERDGQGLPIKTVEMMNGQWIHVATGRPIVVSDLMSRTNNALTSNTGGTQVGALFGELGRFRLYQRGAMDIAQSDQIFFQENQIGMRFIVRYKFGIPTQSRSSFVTLQGVENSTIS